MTLPKTGLDFIKDRINKMTPPKTPMQEIEYDKITYLNKMIQIEKDKGAKATIEQSYIGLMELKVKLMKEAQEFGYNLARKEAEEKQKEFIELLKENIKKTIPLEKTHNFNRNIIIGIILNDIDIVNKHKLSKEVYGGKE